MGRGVSKYLVVVTSEGHGVHVETHEAGKYESADRLGDVLTELYSRIAALESELQALKGEK